MGGFPKSPHNQIKQKCTEQLPKAQGEKFLLLVCADGDPSDFLEEGSFLFQFLMEEVSRKKSTIFSLSLKENNSTKQLKIEKAAQEGQFQLEYSDSWPG